MRRQFVCFSILVLFALLASCGGVDETDPSPDSDIDLIDNDFPAIDGEMDELTEDGDEEDSGDLDSEPEEAEEQEEEIDSLDTDLDRELIRPETDEEDETVEQCQNQADAQCFDNAPAGSSGHRCAGDVLAFCEPSVPEPPLCLTSSCQCTQVKQCADGCVDDDNDGNAYCFGEIDGDEIEQDIEESDGPDSDGDDSDGDDPSDGDGGEEDDMDQDAEDPCLPDEYEPNDGLGQAVAIESGTYENLTVCGTDTDWFLVELQTDGSITATLDFNGQSANLDIYLLDSGGLTIASSVAPTGNREEIVYEAVAGSYYLFILSPQRQDAAYTLTLDLPVVEDGDDEPEPEPEPEPEYEEEIEVCQDDAFEPNDSIEDAVPISVIAYEGLMLCEDNEDFYSISPRSGDTVRIEITFEHDDGDLNLMLYNAEGRQIQSSVGQGNSEELRFPAIDEYYTFRVYSRFGEANSYDMQLYVEPSGMCTDDALEDNDSIFQAGQLTEGSYPDLVLCAYDADIFYIDMQAGQGLKVELFFPHSSGNIDAMITTENNSPLFVADSQSDNEVLYYNADAAGKVYLQVYSIATLRMPYDMVVTISGDFICQDDVFEENDDLDGSFRMINGQHLVDQYGRFDDMMLCANDEDWFSVDLLNRDLVNAKVFYDDTAVSFRLALVKPDATPLFQFRQIEGGIETFTTSDQDGLWSVRLYSDQPVSTPYMMELSVCTEDFQEPNDYRSDAVFLSESTTLSDLAICGDNDDWFSVNLMPGQSMTISINYNASRGNLDLYMTNYLEQVLATGTGPSGVKQIQHSTTVFDSVYFRVTSGGESDNNYQLNLSLNQ